ncbi:MAG: hypothetical protein ACXABD_20825 [Candidatus Thorarchaeota archaeon]|jgi:hypothetical protein
MGQRVNIQYSVELEDLQKEVTRLFNNAIEVLELNPIRPRPDRDTIILGTDGLDSIDLLRRRLAKVDTMLGDIQKIIEGYVRFKTQSSPERETPFQQTSDELEVGQLEEQIAKFKEMFNAKSDQESEEQDE